MKTIKGDLLDLYRRNVIDCLSHCSNCQGKFGSGIALQIKNQFPKAYEAYKDYEESFGLELGTISIGQDYNKAIINLHAQHSYGSGKRFVNYEALYVALEKARKYMITNEYYTIGFPRLMAADRAGGDWRIVEKMIEVVFENSGIEVIIVQYEKGNI